MLSFIMSSHHNTADGYIDFTHWDNAGMSFMLAAMPIALYYVFGEPSQSLLIAMGSGALGLALVVFVLSALTQWEGIGRIIHSLGWFLTIAYIATALIFWI